MKNIRNFVCLSSLVLAGWLGFTFVNKVPPHRYPTLGGGDFPASQTVGTKVDPSKKTGQVDSEHEKLTAVVVSPIGTSSSHE
ncbi:hypothetical protein JIN85_00205 [Luteolibacter pohnpeiensis]|uniref:Uncharacterized protein n=1 Tax=Luteolibacter pohnpeiensis TaxID=454153 RepID=A0A934S1T2_9BACT|nr:hypothetical protein [Luteolibacter pohnpeiensis]MBK1880811.1 hypothetical protein [Luteolibacter pohnpeiensis]